jgi:tetratricopeptide (TPR) repeat protein
MRRIRRVWALAALAGAVVLCSPARAHEGPEHEIEELTERIQSEGASADLLLQRAIEYNVLGKGSEAVKDLQRAVDIEPQSPIILRELARAYFLTGKTNEAIDTASRGLKHATEGAERAGLYMVRADVHRAKRDHAKALEDLDKAIKHHPENPESYLARSRLQLVLGQKRERIAGLEKGVQETGSGLLEAELIDAWIEAGKTDLALAKIEAELKDSRWRGTWLIRRAKVYFAMQQREDARDDLKEALEELNGRMRRGSDPLLYVDRGHVYELLGNKEEAKKDYEHARDKGVADEWLRERVRAVRGDDKKDEKKNEKKPEDKKEDAKAEKKDEAKSDSDDADDKDKEP